MNSAELSTTWLSDSVLTRQWPAVQISFSFLVPLAEATDVAEQTKFPPSLVKNSLPLTS